MRTMIVIAAAALLIGAPIAECKANPLARVLRDLMGRGGSNISVQYGHETGGKRQGGSGGRPGGSGFGTYVPKCTANCTPQGGMRGGTRGGREKIKP